MVAVRSSRLKNMRRGFLGANLSGTKGSKTAYLAKVSKIQLNRLWSCGRIFGLFLHKGLVQRK